MPRPGAGAERPRGPDVDQHRGQVGAGDDDHRRPAAGRPAVGDQRLAHRPGELGVTEHAVAAPQQSGRPLGGRVAAADVLGDQRRGDPHQLAVGQVGGIDRRRPEARVREHADQAEVGPAPARGAGGQHPLGQGSGGPAHQVESAEQLELLGAREVAAGLLGGRCRGLPARPGVVPPPRRWATQPQPRASPSPFTARRPCGPDGPCRAGVVGVGALGGLTGHRGQGVERGAELRLGGHPVGVLEGLDDRRCRQQVGRVTDHVDPAPVEPLHEGVTALVGPAVQLGGSRIGRDRRPSVSVASMPRTSSSYCVPLRTPRPSRWFSRRRTWVSALPSDALVASLSFGAQAGSMPKALQKRCQSRSGSAATASA